MYYNIKKVMKLLVKTRYFSEQFYDSGKESYFDG